MYFSILSSGNSIEDNGNDATNATSDEGFGVSAMDESGPAHTTQVGCAQRQATVQYAIIHFQLGL